MAVIRRERPGLLRSVWIVVVTILVVVQSPCTHALDVTQHVVNAALSGVTKQAVSFGARFAESLVSRFFGGGQSLRDAPYDVVVKVDDLMDLLEGSASRGWPILVRDKLAGQRLESWGSVNTVAVVGLYNRGKSFLLSKLAGVSFPEGLTVHTEGLSIVFSRSEDRTRYIDTAGSDQPAVVQNRSTLQGDPLLQRRATDSFLREAVFALADVCFVMVDQLTLSDQVYINRVKDHYRARLNSLGMLQRKLLVVHNLKHLRTRAQVEQRIAVDIEQAFSATPAAKSTDTLVWQDPDSVFHVVLAAEGSEAGNVYNEKTIQYLHERLGQIVRERGDSDDILQRLCDHVNEALPQYLKTSAECITTTGHQNVTLATIVMPECISAAQFGDDNETRYLRCSPRLLVTDQNLQKHCFSRELRSLQFDGPLVMRAGLSGRPSARIATLYNPKPTGATVEIDVPGLGCMGTAQSMLAFLRNSAAGDASACTTELQASKSKVSYRLQQVCGGHTSVVMQVRVLRESHNGFPPHVSFWFNRTDCLMDAASSRAPAHVEVLPGGSLSPSHLGVGMQLLKQQMLAPPSNLNANIEFSATQCTQRDPCRVALPDTGCASVDCNPFQGDVRATYENGVVYVGVPINCACEDQF